MRTTKRDRTPRKKGGEQSYWVKSHEENDGFIPRACYNEQSSINLRPHAFTHKCTLVAESYAKEAVNIREEIQCVCAIY